MTAAPVPQRSPWLFGPAPDLLVGCGLGYALAFAALAGAGAQLRGGIPFEYGPLLLLLSGTPHYGATLLRVYERRDDRRAYTIFAVWMSAVIAAAFGAAVVWPIVGSLMLTLMLTWSPWHYTGQNYGIALMFLRRGGTPISPGLKRVIYASFFLSFLLTVLAVHGARPTGQYAPTGFGGSVYRFLPLGIPDAVRTVGFAVCGTGWAAATIAALVLLARRGAGAALLPAGVLFATQALWFVAPTLARHYAVWQGVEPLGAEHAAYAFLWVAIGHSIQYLWISSYYARQQQRAGSGMAAYYAKCVLAGAAIWTVPGFLLAPGVLGRVPYDLGLAALISAAVNLHHFVLDGAIWKLRDGRVARILLRARGEVEPDPAGPPRRLRPALAVWAVGAVCALVIVAATLESELGFNRSIERGDLPRAERSIQRLAWIGRDSPSLRAGLAAARARAGDLDGAARDVETSLVSFPTAEGWRAKGWIAELRGEPAEAIGAYQRALELDANQLEAANNLAWLRATSADPLLRDGPQAVELAEGVARATGFGEPGILDTLAAAYASALRFDAAVRTAQRAADLAAARGDDALAGEITARLEGYRRGEPFTRDPARESAHEFAGDGASLRRTQRLQ
jgi:hypothetical protein